MVFHATTQSEAETVALGERLGVLLRGGDVVLLDGDLGAGKTQFAKGVARGLGIKQPLTSPTYNLVLEYPLPTQEKFLSASGSVSGSAEDRCEGSVEGSFEGSAEDSFEDSPAGCSQDLVPKMLRHFDLYRLERAEQLDDIDYFGLIEDSAVVSLVEWGSKFSESLPLDFLLIDIKTSKNNTTHREIEVSARGSHSEGLLSRLARPGEATRHE